MLVDLKKNFNLMVLANLVSEKVTLINIYFIKSAY